MAMSLRWIFSVKFPGKVSVYLHRRENKVRAMTGIFRRQSTPKLFSDENVGHAHRCALFAGMFFSNEVHVSVRFFNFHKKMSILLLIQVTITAYRSVLSQQHQVLYSMHTHYLDKS